jgi:hypothetical protein
MRQRITDQFTERYNQARQLQAELDAIEAAQPPNQDITLLDELPYLAENFADAPDDIKAKLYAAFDVQVLHRAHKNQATIWATITTSTPGIVAALATDPRTDDDTAYGNLTPAPIWSLSTPNLLALVLKGQSELAGAGNPGEKSNWDGALRAG